MAEIVLTPLGWLASPLIKTLFNKAHDHLGTGIDEKMKILEATVLPRLSLAIDKAEKSPNKEKLVDWLNRLKGAYYEAEEAIDLLEYNKLKQKVKVDKKTLEQRVKNERATPICLPLQFVPPKLKDSISWQKTKLKSHIDKLIEISKETKEFHDLLGVQENASGSENDRDTFSNPPDRVFGRERDKKNIVDLLTDKPLNSEPVPSTRPAIPIIAITGRSGVGKTALAQYVYKHMDEQKHFDLPVWVHAPRKFKATDVIKIMIEIIEAKKDPPTTDEALLKHTRGMLRSKKLLLVLDDFWSDTEGFHEQWEKFFKFLSSCLPGSRILLTTQSKNAAQQAGLAHYSEVETYNLEEIEEGQFSELFMHHAWPSNFHSQKEEFEKVGRKIAVKLKGDPGAAKLVGHQLSGKLHLRHWEEVAEKDWLGDNLKARIWSYQQLPHDLQRCFVICSLFPKGTCFQREVLIAIWMAEGFIRPTDIQERLEDTGENYLDELVSRFFLEQVVFNERIYYELHDLLHDLAEHVQGDDFLRIDFTNSEQVPSQISPMLFRSENIRHISLPSTMINKLKAKICLMKNIRTFCVQFDGGFVPKKVLEDILKNLKKLRVLQLPECGDDLPDSIGNLKHLRLLHSYGSRPKLPNSICKLYHLQTLLLQDCEPLPKDFSELISLRHFHPGREMSRISHVGRLTSLQSLDQFVVRKKRGNELHQLENLNQLRGKMCITGLENVESGLENVESTTDAVIANMRNKKHLKQLLFEWNSHECNTNNATNLSTQHVQLLDALEPHPNISALTIKGFGGDRFPNWFLSQNSLRLLKSVTLINCDKVEEISSIAESLPNCESLILRWLKNLKTMPSLPSNLTYLVIDHLPKVSYFSEDDLLMKEERNQSKLQVVKKIAECLKLNKKIELTVKEFLLFMKERLEAPLGICFRSSRYGNIFSEIENYDPLNEDYSRDQLLDMWVMFMQYHMETMFNKNEESKLILPSSLTYLKISSCSITSDALSTCIQCLAYLSKLKLSDIQTITSLPPKEVLCSLKILKSLTIKGCYLLSSLGGIGALTSLIALKLNECINLIPSNGPLPSTLESLKFRNCSNVDVVLTKSNLPVLRSLNVQNITSKNQRGVLHVGHLSCLEELAIFEWDGRLEGLNSLKNLHSLGVMCCPEINASSPMDKYTSALEGVLVDNLALLKLILSNETISSIEVLSIIGFQEDSSNDEVFQSLTSLTDLFLTESNITHLPKNLKNLSSVQYMDLENCRNLCELKELPKNLRELKITDCPSLTKKLNKGGPYQVWLDKGSTIVAFPTEEDRNHF